MEDDDLNVSPQKIHISFIHLKISVWKPFYLNYVSFHDNIFDIFYLTNPRYFYFSTINRIYKVSFKLEFKTIIHRVLQWRKSEGNIWKCNASHIFPKTTYAQFELPSFYYEIVFHAFYPRGSLDVKIEILNKGQRKLHTCITCKRSYALRIHSNVFESI